MQIEGPVGPVGVVVVDILTKDRLEVAAAEDEHPVQALPSPSGAEEVPKGRSAPVNAGADQVSNGSPSQASCRHAHCPWRRLPRQPTAFKFLCWTICLFIAGLIMLISNIANVPIPAEALWNELLDLPHHGA